MPEKDSRELLTLETVNSNMNKKLDKIINYLEKSDYSPRINSFSDSITNSLIKNGLTLNDNSRISQIQIPRLFQEDKK